MSVFSVWKSQPVHKKLASRLWSVLFTLTYSFIIHALSSSAGRWKGVWGLVSVWLTNATHHSPKLFICWLDAIRLVPSCETHNFDRSGVSKQNTHVLTHTHTCASALTHQTLIHTNMKISDTPSLFFKTSSPKVVYVLEWIAILKVA